MPYREIASSPLTLYVRQDGDDGNNGQQDTPADALKTVQRAIGLLSAYDLGGLPAAIVIGAGTFAGGSIWSKPPGQKGPIIIRSSSGVFTDTVLSGGLLVDEGAFVRVGGMTLTAPTTKGSCLDIRGGSCCQFGNVAFGYAGYMQINVAGAGARADAVSSFAVNGNAQGFLHVTNTAFATLNDVSAYLSGQTYSAYFAGLAACSGLQAYNFTVNGVVNGPRFTVHKNSVIDTGGQDKLSYFPGSSPGVEATGGRWV